MDLPNYIAIYTFVEKYILRKFIAQMIDPADPQIAMGQGVTNTCNQPALRYFSVFKII
jgi:hypothetical protein